MNIHDLLQSEQALLLIKPSDLEKFADQIAAKILSGQPIQAPIKTESDKPLTQAEAIKFLGKSRQTLAKLRHKGLIKSYKLGGRIYFKQNELLDALKKN